MLPPYLGKRLAVGHSRHLLLLALAPGPEVSVMQRFHGDPSLLHGCGHIRHAHMQGSWVVVVVVCSAVPRGARHKLCSWLPQQSLPQARWISLRGAHLLVLCAHFHEQDLAGCTQSLSQNVSCFNKTQ